MPLGGTLDLYPETIRSLTQKHVANVYPVSWYWKYSWLQIPKQKASKSFWVFAIVLAELLTIKLMTIFRTLWNLNQLSELKIFISICIKLLNNIVWNFFLQDP